jgi:hypothetical protein
MGINPVPLVLADGATVFTSAVMAEVAMYNCPVVALNRMSPDETA